MSDTQTRGGFAGDPATALTVTGSSGCCGNAPQTTDFLATEPAKADAPCCGTRTEAQASGSCCGATAKAEAVSAGAGCCG
jgi:hypothetical protein